MSHQTGIKACEDLRLFFANSKDGYVRLMKIAIVDEEMVLDHSAAAYGSWEQDYDQLVSKCLDSSEPCFIMYRLDSRNDSGYQWLFISYAPDHSSVRSKMLYAATRATLKSEFGAGQIKDELFGTSASDVDLEGYKKHLKSEHAPAPLTFAEEELEMIKKNEVRADVGINTKHQTMQGVAFPVSDDAYEKLLQLKDGIVNYVQLSIDIVGEMINLESCEDTDNSMLPSRIRQDHARYHFFNYKHTHEGDYMELCVFIYSMPSCRCPIKERMLYASCKARLLSLVEEEIGITIVRKLEISEPKEVVEECLYDEIHPKKNVARQQFARPRGPAGRGPKRLTRATNGENEN